MNCNPSGCRCWKSWIYRYAQAIPESLSSSHHVRTGAAMPKIVKSDLFQLIICKDNSEVLCNEVWSYKLAQLIHINVVQILPAIRAATYPPIGFLLRSHTKQQLLKRFYQRQRAITGLCFRPFLVNHSYLTIQHNLCDGVLDCEGFAFKIDRVPFSSFFCDPGHGCKRSTDDESFFIVRRRSKI